MIIIHAVVYTVASITLLFVALYIFSSIAWLIQEGRITQFANRVLIAILKALTRAVQLLTSVVHWLNRKA